jgi:general secretion pathway protein E
MGVENFLLSSTIRGILAQRLVRVICPHCQELDSTAFTAEELQLLGSDQTMVPTHGRGCEICSFTGYFGRLGIFELLVVDDDIRRLILKHTDATEMRQVARKKGMRTLLEDGVDKVRAQRSTLREVLRVTQEI